MKRTVFMTNISQYDVIIVKFPYASSLKYKARPAVVVSSDLYNKKGRDTLLILAISSNVKNKMDFEVAIEKWKASGLLKPSIFKSAVATIEKNSVLAKVGNLEKVDKENLARFLQTIC